MKLTVFNGSPRGLNSNSRAILDHFLKGFAGTTGNTCEVFYLKNSTEIDYHTKQFHDAENVIFVFPLYIDSVPAILKNFFETLKPCNNRKSVGFIIQSGFPESRQFYCLEKYLRKLASRNNWFYLGTVVRGAGEGIRIIQTISNPIHKLIHFIGRKTNIGGVGYFLNNKRTFRLFYQLGQDFGKSGEFNLKVLDKLAEPLRLSKVSFLLYRLIAEHLYFNTILRANNAFSKRFDKPYSCF